MATKSAYGAAEREIRELFGDYLEGEGSCTALVLSSSRASNAVRTALERSFDALGYGSDSLAYATLRPGIGVEPSLSAVRGSTGDGANVVEGAAEAKGTGAAGGSGSVDARAAGSSGSVDARAAGGSGSVDARAAGSSGSVDARAGGGEQVAQLDAPALYLLVEGIDPCFVVITDRHASKQLGAAMRAEYGNDAIARVNGRAGVSFSDLDSLIASEKGKRKAWELLKTLK